MKKPKKKTYHKKRKKQKGSPFIILLIPVVLLALYGILHKEEKPTPVPHNEKVALIPPKYIPIYKAAEKRYGVPWYVLAAHHRVETRFSTMDPMISPVGAEGPMQFMPCTFVGWRHPSCDGMGKGNIPEEEKEDPDVIKKYGGYGVDANGDGRADLWNIEDAVFSAANFLSQNGAADGKMRKAIFSYNHSDQYVEDVLNYVKLYKSDY